MTEGRRPGGVPDELPVAGPDGRNTSPGGAASGGDGSGWDFSDRDVADGWDTDGDGRGDTVVTTEGIDLVLLSDLDGDTLADQVLRIGPDGVVREAVPREPLEQGVEAAGLGVVDGLLGGVGMGWVP